MTPSAKQRERDGYQSQPTRAYYEALIDAGKNPWLEAEFQRWLEDMQYVFLSKAARQYLWEAFIGGNVARAERERGQ